MLLLLYVLLNAAAFLNFPGLGMPGMGKRSGELLMGTVSSIDCADALVCCRVKDGGDSKSEV